MTDEEIRLMAVAIRDAIHNARGLSAYGALCETIEIINRHLAPKPA